MYEQIEKDELLRMRKFQSSKRQSSKLVPEPDTKAASAKKKTETQLNFHLNRENLNRLEQQSVGITDGVLDIDTAN
jgi:hypothetical protein